MNQNQWNQRPPYNHQEEGINCAQPTYSATPPPPNFPAYPPQMFIPQYLDPAVVYQQPPLVTTPPMVVPPIETNPQRKFHFNSKDNVTHCISCGRINILAETEIIKKDKRIDNLEIEKQDLTQQIESIMAKHSALQLKLEAFQSEKSQEKMCGGSTELQKSVKVEVPVVVMSSPATAEVPGISADEIDFDLRTLLLSIEEVALCPICLDLVKPPVTLCVNGHGVCTACKATLTKCPTCRKPFCSTEPRILNEILQKIPKVCKYYDGGCRIPSTGDHELYCGFRTVKCVFHDKDSSEYCDWEGPAKEFKGHVYDIDHMEPGYTDINDVSSIRFRKFKEIAPTMSVFDDGEYGDDGENDDGSNRSYDTMMFYHTILNGNFCLYIKYLPLKEPTEIIYFTISFVNSTDNKVMYMYQIKATTMITLERDVKVEENVFCMRVPVEALEKLLDKGGDLCVNYKKTIVPL